MCTKKVQAKILTFNSDYKKVEKLGDLNSEDEILQAAVNLSASSGQNARIS